MQNYNQQPPAGYQRPGSTASFAGQPPPPPPLPPAYGTPQGYQSVAPQTQGQWAPPPQNQTNSQQWNQQSAPAAGGYNPGVYGAMPGGYGQQQTPATAPPNPYTPQQQDVPPPPPPKPHGFAAAVQQQQQSSWPSQPQQNTSYSQSSQGYPQTAPQQGYNNAAPPPPSQTPGGSYFPPSQGGRPGSIYGADQAGSISSPMAQQPPNTVLSPNEQQPAHIPPSLSGQGVQAYMPSNTNPMPGVYVPPPPDIPAWQQAQHAPLQGGNKKYRYTKPSVDPSFYAQGYQGVQPMQQLQQPQQQQAQGQFSQQPQQNQQQFGQQPPQNQFQQQGQAHSQAQFGQPLHQQQPPAQFSSPAQQQNQFQPPQPQQPTQPQEYNSQAPTNPQMQPPQQYPQQQNQWQQASPANQGYAQQQQPTQVLYGGQQQTLQQQGGWQPMHQAQGSITGQPYTQGQDQGIQAPKPVGGHGGNTPPNFINEQSPPSQPVSPVTHRQSMSFSSTHNQSSLGRTSSVSSIAFSNLQSQRVGVQTTSPKPAPPKNPTPPPPRDSSTAFSALGMGGPSDWEHFGAGEEVDDEELFAKKNDKPVQLDSVEIPAPVRHQPSPPPTQDEWPSPAIQPAPLNIGSRRRDTYQPTPPPQESASTQRPPSQPAQNTFVMGDTVAAPATTHSPAPIQATEPPPTQQGFVMDDGGWAAPSQSTPSQQQAQHQPPPAQQGFVMDDGGWSAQAAATQARQQTPAQQQQQQQPPPATTGFSIGDGAWGASQQTPAQTSTAWAPPNQNHEADLKEKDEAFERLKLETKKEKADMQTEIVKLSAVLEAVKSQAASERAVLREQIEAMKTTAEQAKTNADALSREKDMTVERLKEDAEGKDDVIKEKDTAIADLKRQLEAEKTKEVPKPTPADLVPDIDPWYAGSLERYIAMLRNEAGESQVEDKIKVFKAFLKAESEIRGLEYHDAPPPPVAQVQESVVQQAETAEPSRRTSDVSGRRHDLNVQIPQEATSPEDEFQYSPGGRPIMRQKPSTMKLNENESVQHSTQQPGQSLTILTPTSSTDDNLKTPVQSPPEEPMQAQPQYKAYVPPSMPQTISTEPVHRQTPSFPNTPPVGPVALGKGHDEIFFGSNEPQPKSAPMDRPSTSESTISDIPVPAPLSFTPQLRPSSSAPAAKQNPISTLTDLLPAQISLSRPNEKIEELRKKIADIPSDFDYINTLTTTWEKTASLTRRKNDDARRKRQEENEEQTDQLFNDNEISYADIGELEDEFKEKERESKAQEDRDEYKNYVETVFDKVYDGLQKDIKALMDIHVQAEDLLHSSVSGTKSLEGADVPTTQQSLELLTELHKAVEMRHEKVVQAVSERDKRYKKTEIQPLYAAGNITKMKNVEKHFENAEKQAVLRSKGEKAERVGELVRVAEEVVVGAVGIEQGEIDRIVSAIKSLDKAEADLLNKARDTLTALKASSKSLLTAFNALEIELNSSVLEAEIAQARAENAEPARVQQLERELADGEKKLQEEFERRVGVLEQDTEVIDGLVKEKGGQVQLTEEQEKEQRMRIALEEAKKRNGAI